MGKSKGGKSYGVIVCMGTQNVVGNVRDGVRERRRKEGMRPSVGGHVIIVGTDRGE